jgi:hypothetical protein
MPESDWIGFLALGHPPPRHYQLEGKRRAWATFSAGLGESPLDMFILPLLKSHHDDLTPLGKHFSWATLAEGEFEDHVLRIAP